ncbi:winged helix-turn-helix domain-containing protein [Pseudoalteromonas luteoviolacea]|uniref:winged helix-turn-helix domain-containing protein n=1 Tax=Pseudoalteromonas luteoviolacea TaxID=43657 RepID=UPI001B389BF5|nr:winged helix-turn-helix domain-containing protein [Pseudoalteromonas luteoviolacea]MBQ4814542.1 winged helix-turn-helix domain-containing protein [Pseudoalteromonas luteoviolacea]
MQKDIMRVSLGEFVLDLEQRLLFLNDEEIAVEPKVMELLLYLHQCRGRYVTIEELHEHVWADRIVTDTAVRGTVKKLRVIFKDDDISAPSYIKSVPKRGYKLICESHPIAIEQPVPDVRLESESINAVLSPTKEKSNQHQPLIYIALFALLILGAAISYINEGWSFPSTNVTVSSVEELTEFKGEKTSVAVSRDGRYIAFTGRAFKSEHSQVYLYDKLEKTTRQLTNKEPHATFVRFAQNDKALIFTNSLTGNSSLKLLPLTVSDPESAMVTLLEGRYLIGEIQLGRTSSEVIIQLANAPQSKLMLYAIDLEGYQETRLVAVSQSDEFIVSASTSPDRTRLVTLNLQAGRTQLVLHDLATQQETRLIDGTMPLKKVVWRNNNELLLLNNSSIRLFNIKERKEYVVYENHGALINMIESDHQGGLVVIKKSQQRAERLYIERSFSGDGAVSKVIDTRPEIASMMYDPQDKDLKWVRILKDDRNSLGSFNVKTKHIDVYYQSESRLEFLDVSKDHKWMLFKENYRLAVYSVERQKVYYLTASFNSSSDGVFYQDDKYILYGVQVGGKWEIQRYDLATEVSDVFLAGYRSIRPTSQGYVVAGETGELAYLDSHLGVAQALNHRIGLEPITRWHVREDQIVWSTYDHLKSYIHHFDLNRRHYHVTEDFFLSLYPRISVDSNAARVVHLSVQINDAALQQVNFK